MMLFGLLWGCAQEPYAIPESDIYQSDELWQGSLSFVSNTCATVYSLEGEEQECEECTLSVRFVLSSLEEECLFSDLEVLHFRISEAQEWLVLEESGWELWGSAEEQDNIWNLRSDRFFYPIK